MLFLTYWSSSEPSLTWMGISSCVLCLFEHISYRKLPYKESGRFHTWHPGILWSRKHPDQYWWNPKEKRGSSSHHLHCAPILKVLHHILYFSYIVWIAAMCTIWGWLWGLFRNFGWCKRLQPNRWPGLVTGIRSFPVAAASPAAGPFPNPIQSAAHDPQSPLGLSEGLYFTNVNLQVSRSSGPSLSPNTVTDTVHLIFQGLPGDCS